MTKTDFGKRRGSRTFRNLGPYERVLKIKCACGIHRANVDQ